VQIDARWSLQRLQSRDRRHQLHAIVGRERLTAAYLFAMDAGYQNGAPAARARVARAGAIGMDYHGRFCPLAHPNPYSLAETMVR
jgi:hypothetical protein